MEPPLLGNVDSFEVAKEEYTSTFGKAEHDCPNGLVGGGCVCPRGACRTRLVTCDWAPSLVAQVLSHGSPTCGWPPVLRAYHVCTVGCASGSVVCCIHSWVVLCWASIWFAFAACHRLLWRVVCAWCFHAARVVCAPVFAIPSSLSWDVFRGCMLFLLLHGSWVAVPGMCWRTPDLWDVA